MVMMSLGLCVIEIFLSRFFAEYLSHVCLIGDLTVDIYSNSSAFKGPIRHFC